MTAVREELAELQGRFNRVMDDVRRLPGGEMVWQRVDAYPGTRLDRDMGAGVDADCWIGEMAEFLAIGWAPYEAVCPALALLRAHGLPPQAGTGRGTTAAAKGGCALPTAAGLLLLGTLGLLIERI